MLPHESAAAFCPGIGPEQRHWRTSVFGMALCGVMASRLVEQKHARPVPVPSQNNSRSPASLSRYPDRHRLSELNP
jgi:hypothetical protein